MDTPWNQFVEKARNKNQPGRGRPYAIRTLLLWAGLAQQKGRSRRLRITRDRRLKLAEMLEHAGLTYDWVLDEKKETTHVWHK